MRNGSMEIGLRGDGPGGGPRRGLEPSLWVRGYGARVACYEGVKVED